jgi:lysophospholipase L1-like esterase
MMRRINCIVISFVIVFLFVFSNCSIKASAQRDKLIIVSLGDSYSSGEGITPFYGDEKRLKDRVNEEDWLAHRSQKSWGGRLKVTGFDEMKNYRKTERSYDNCQWYFAAASGAETKHIISETQPKVAYKEDTVYTLLGSFQTVRTGSADLDKQIDIFKKINGTVDYVTLTVGGNDAGFEDIVITCATGSTYIEDWRGKDHQIDTKLEEAWGKIGTIKENLEKTYKAIANSAPQAEILVGGYPLLFDASGKGMLISGYEAQKVNKKVADFNSEINKVVEKCSGEGIKISFVDVVDAENGFRGHEAYANNPWINEIIIGSRWYDISDYEVASAASMHPNEEGAKAYARCFNKTIEEKEKEKKFGNVSGKVCYAYDRSTPVPSAYVFSRKVDGGRAYINYANANGNYDMTVAAGRYEMKIDAPGCVTFTAYANVVEDRTTYMETFLLVEGQEGDRGVAKGQITNALTGRGVSNAEIKVYNGWNNTEDFILLKTIKTDSYGNYELDLPIGNYSLVINKNGFITGEKNIIVQRGVTDNQNASISPTVTGNKFRIVLSWGLNPNDLDSHVVGKLSNGSDYHVYYRHKSQYDGDVEVCNLDVDDTTSWGPETVTLLAEQNSPYYYYIHRYAGSGSIATSNARIDVYQGDNLIATYNVPTDQGTGDYWNVFAIDNGQIIERNTMTDQPEITYAEHGIVNSSLRLMRAGTSFLDELLNLGDKKDGDAKEEAAASASSSIDENEAAASASSSVDENEAAASASSSEDVAAASTSGSSATANVDSAAVSKSEDDEKSAESSSADGATTTDSSAEASSAVNSGAAASGSTSSDNAGTGSSVSEGSGSEEPNPDSASAGM